MDKKHFDKPMGHLNITIDSPLIGSIAAPNATVVTHRSQEFRLLIFDGRVFDRDQHRSSKMFFAQFFDEDWHAPVVPWTEVCGGIRELGKQSKDCAPDGAQAGIDKS
jgi:hypothetical protein